MDSILFSIQCVLWCWSNIWPCLFHVLSPIYGLSNNILGNHAIMNEIINIKGFICFHPDIFCVWLSLCHHLTMRFVVKDENPPALMVLLIASAGLSAGVDCSGSDIDLALNWGYLLSLWEVYIDIAVDLRCTFHLPSLFLSRSDTHAHTCLKLCTSVEWCMGGGGRWCSMKNLQYNTWATQ